MDVFRRVALRGLARVRRALFFFAVERFAVDFLAVVRFRAAVRFLAVVRVLVVFFLAVDFFAVFFFAVVDFLRAAGLLFFGGSEGAGAAGAISSILRGPSFP